MRRFTCISFKGILVILHPRVFGHSSPKRHIQHFLHIGGILNNGKPSIRRKGQGEIRQSGFCYISNQINGKEYQIGMI